MTIDEAINFVENMIYNYRPYGEQLEDWCKLLNLLRWYREQDLIRREDIKERCHCTSFREEYCKSTTPCKECCEYGLMVDEIDEIPKAKPPKENE